MNADSEWELARRLTKLQTASVSTLCRDEAILFRWNGRSEKLSGPPERKQAQPAGQAARAQPELDELGRVTHPAPMLC
jgi:hypothetical protein